MDIGLSDVLAILLTLAGGAFSAWVTAKLLPLDHRPPRTADFAELSRKYKQWQMWVALAWAMALLPTSCYGGWRLLTWLADLRFARLQPFEYAFHPGHIEIGLVAVFLSMLVSTLLLWLAMRIYLGARYAEYQRYERQRWGIPRDGPIVALGVALAAVFGLAAAALLDNYVVLTEDGIRMDGFFSPTERAYTYNAVKAIRTAPNWAALVGNEVERREYVVCFSDGGSWSTSWTPGAVSDEDRARVMKMVSEKSKVPIAELPLLTRQLQSCE